MSEFIEHVRSEMRVRHMSLRTEKAYLGWIKQYIRFNDRKHPKDLGNLEIERFLHYLANDRKVSSSTQTQALCALVFLYNKVLNIEITGLKYGHSKKPKRLPTIIDTNEARKILNCMTGKHQLIGNLLFGSGLRINEALKLRIKDINFTNNTVFVFRGKGGKDRYTILPESIVPALREQIEYSKRLHNKDLREGYGLSSLPTSLIKKYKDSAKGAHWQYIFPSPVRCHHPVDGYMCRHHLHDSAFSKHLRVAVKESGIAKKVTAHTFRHTFATQLLLHGTDIRTLQELLGHSDIRTNEIYTHVVGSKFAGTKSPVDY